MAGCRAGAPAIGFAPPGTDLTKVQSEFPLTSAERSALTPETLRKLDQDQLDQIYARLTSVQIPDGPFRGDLFFPRGQIAGKSMKDLDLSLPAHLADLAAMPIEQLGRALWKGKVFFRSQGTLRNRIEDLAILKPIIKDTGTIPKLTFDGATTWLLFPAAVSCGDSLLDTTRHSIVIDYSQGPQSTAIEGFRMRWQAPRDWISATRFGRCAPACISGAHTSGRSSG